jgi:alanyl-tRNA synthetase
MVPFKRFYDGTVEPPFRRTTSAQKCLRVKGKASDLENVGRTPRHMTFFEMLGNFSFGDYFKSEAIAWAWEFLDVVGLDKSRVWVSIFEDDDEAGEIWANEIGVPRERIVKMGRKDNFWGPAGETGACGPCSELLYDRGEEFGVTDPVNNDDRFLEFWNLVFPQFDYSAENPTRPLKNRGIDTGMGLERLAMLVQGKSTIFETDGLAPTCAHLAQLVDRPYGESDEVTAAINACVDHARCLTFAISEGIIPSNEGRGYVMRAIIRRAIRLYKTRLACSQPVLWLLVDDFITALGEVYPQITVGTENTTAVIRREEETFLRTVAQGEQHLREYLQSKRSFIDAAGKILENARRSTRQGTSEDKVPDLYFGIGGIVKLAVFAEGVKWEFSDDRARETIAYLHTLEGRAKSDREFHYRADSPEVHDIIEKLEIVLDFARTFSGRELFYFYETFGYPFELLKEIGEEIGLVIDEQGLQEQLTTARAKARAAWKGAELAESEKLFNPIAEKHGETEFVGYDALIDQVDVVALTAGGKLAEELKEGQDGEVILTSTPFYAESGGQIGDTGTITHGDAIFTVSDTQKTTHGLRRHIGKMTKGTLSVGQVAKAEVDAPRRARIRVNHTATHLLNAALRRHLGNHVKQAGSLVAENHLRFDFTHGQALGEELLREVEATANRYVTEDHHVTTRVMPIEEARKTGAVAVFGEKYGDVVRVVAMGPDSVEFCGGTHLERTGQTGAFVITEESSIAAGTRRIVALAGDDAIRHIQSMRERETHLARLLSTRPDGLEERLTALQEENRNLRREVTELRQRASAADVQSAAGDAVEINGVKLIARTLRVVDAGELRNAADVARAGKTFTAVVLGAALKGKAAVIAAVTDDLRDRLPAGKLVNEVAALVGGKGGGRADLAQAGGKDVDQLDAAIAKVPEIVKSLLEK